MIKQKLVPKIRAYDRNFTRTRNHPSHVLALRVELRTRGLISFLSVSSDRQEYKSNRGATSQDKGLFGVTSDSCPASDTSRCEW